MLNAPDFRELLSLFRSNSVRFLVVGGYAVMRYSEPRYTKDLDLWVSADPRNAQSVFAALKAFGAPLQGLTPEDFAHEGYFYQMGAPPLRVDIIMSIAGMKFDEVWQRREDTTVEGVVIPFISKTDLIRSKEAAGRPQDLIDVQNLKKTLQGR